MERWFSREPSRAAGPRLPSVWREGKAEPGAGPPSMVGRASPEGGPWGCGWTGGALGGGFNGREMEGVRGWRMQLQIVNASQQNDET